MNIENKIDEFLLTLVRMALNKSVCTTDIEWEQVSEQEWKKCYLLSVEQGVMAMTWDRLGRKKDSFC